MGQGFQVHQTSLVALAFSKSASLNAKVEEKSFVVYQVTAKTTIK